AVAGGEVHMKVDGRAAFAIAISAEDWRLDQGRRRSVVRIIPFKHEGERVAGAVDCLRDILFRRIAAWIEVMKTAGVKFWRHAGKIDVGIFEAGVTCGI